MRVRMKVTNHDLHVMLARVEEKLDGVKEWQASHQENDSKQFKELNDNLSDMTRYAASIAIVAGAIGACGAWMINKITGQS